MMKRYLSLCSMALVCAGMMLPRLAGAAYHVAVIDEVVTSFGGDPSVQFIEMRMLIGHQNLVGGSTFGIFGATGTHLGNINIPTDVSNDGAGVRWLVGSDQYQTNYGGTVPRDFPMTGGPALDTAGGMVCFGKPGAQPQNPSAYNVDCLAYGTYSGTVPSSAGMKTVQDGIGHSLQRNTNTSNNANDFVCGDPSTPQNNAGATTSLSATTACPATPTVTATVTMTPTPAPVVTCPATPFPVCKTSPPGKSSYQISGFSSPTKRKMSWKWNNGQATAASEFGNPVTTANYTFCVYNGAGTIVMQAAVGPGGTCDGKPCWKQSGTPATGYKYKSKAALSYGISAIGLKEGAAGKTKISLKGKGESLLLPALPIVQTPGSLQIQLINDSGGCWGASYSNPPNSDVADTQKFKDKND